MMHLLLSCLIALFITAFMIETLKPLCLKIGLFDAPGGRKHHKGNVPLIGGLAMFVGFGFALLTLPLSLAEYRSLIAGSALLVFVGLLDDLHELSPRARFVAQIFAGLLITCWGQIEVHHIGHLFSDKNITLYQWSLPFTVIAVVGVINAVNMTDGLDGLAGGLSFIEVGFLTWLANHAGLFNDTSLLLLLLTAIGTFLWFNLRTSQKKSAVFMGDSGSMFLGWVLVWFLISLSQPPKVAAHPMTMLWIMAVPLFDMVSVMMRRLVKRQSPFRSDREHIHHLFLALGFSSRMTTVVLCLIALVCGAVGILGEKFQMPEQGMFLSFMLLFSGYFLFSYVVWEKSKQRQVYEPEPS